MALRRLFFIPDSHIPYEDKRAFELMLRGLEEFKPDVLHILGDFGDCFCVSDHDKDPNRARDLEWEIEAINKRLDQIDKIVGGITKKFVEGNHEWRLERYLMRKAPELFNMLKIRELLKLDERGWLYTPYKQHATTGKLHVTHDTGKAGRHAHAQSLDDFQSNVVIGHTHRMGITYSGNAQGKSHVGAMFGWLGDTRKADYMAKIKALRDWQLGFGIGFSTGEGVAHLQAVPIIAYQAVVNGQLIRG